LKSLSNAVEGVRKDEISVGVLGKRAGYDLSNPFGSRVNDHGEDPRRRSSYMDKLLYGSGNLLCVLVCDTKQALNLL